MAVHAERSMTRQVKVGDTLIGGSSPISVQSMTNVPTTDVRRILEQINTLALRGAEIVRLAVPDMDSALALKAIVEGASIPVVADIHFDPRLALAALDSGVHKLRLNPGNIRDKRDVWKIAEKASALNVPIRIGVNSGSLPGDIRDRFGGVNADSMWVSAQRHCELLEETGFRDIVISLKSSSARLTIEANRKAAANSDYPLHLGVTEAGPGMTGAVRSAVAISILLSEGIGDTLRVSLSGDPAEEPVVAWEILSSLGLRERRFPTIISCPTCARSRMDVAQVACKVQDSLSGIQGDVSIAVMGCEVNGPGEAREADIALIGTPSGIHLLVNGELKEKLEFTQMPERLIDTVISYITGGSRCQED